MNFLSRFSCMPNSSVVVKDGSNDVHLRVLSCSIETEPDDEPVVKLECLFDRQYKMDKKLKTQGAMSRKKVIYAPPATIVLWEDGTKTIVKCDERDTYDAKYGLALCYMKKALGNTSRALNDVLHEEAISDD